MERIAKDCSSCFAQLAAEASLVRRHVLITFISCSGPHFASHNVVLALLSLDQIALFSFWLSKTDNFKGLDTRSEGVVAPCCNPLTLQPEQSGERGSNPNSTLSIMTRGRGFD